MTISQTPGRIRWAPRVSREKLRRLYQADARRIVDEELLDDVGTTLYCRCQDILIVSDAAEGRMICHQCRSIIARDGDDKDQIIVCSSCGWSIGWGDYQRTYRHHELYARGLTEEIQHFISAWERASSPREKMLLIDRLIHVWHWEARTDHDLGGPRRLISSRAAASRSSNFSMHYPGVAGQNDSALWSLRKAQFATGRSSARRYLAPRRRAVAARTRRGPAKHANAKGR
jgi:hypothetical protein